MSRERLLRSGITYFILFLVALFIVLQLNPLEKSYLMPHDIVESIQPWRNAVGLENWQDNVANRLLGDAVVLFYPWRYYLKKYTLLYRNIPLWNPYVFCGLPFLANNQSAVFSPFNLLLFFISPLASMTVYPILSLIFSYLFMYLFLMDIGLKRFSAFIGGLVFSLSGFFITWLEFQVLTMTSMWIPALFFIINRIFESGKKVKYVFLGAFAIAFQVFSGHLQLLMYSFMLYFAFMFFLAIKNKNYGNLLLCFFMLISGMMIGGIQILPSLELASLSGRSARPLEYIMQTKMPFRNILTAFIPNILGSNASGFCLRGLDVVNSGCIFVSLTAIFLAIFSFMGNSYKDVRNFFAVVALVALLTATGILYPIFYYFIPGFNVLGYISRIVILYVFSISMLTALGTDIMFNQAFDEKKFLGISKFLRIFCNIVCVLAIFIMTLVFFRYKTFTIFISGFQDIAERIIGFSISQPFLNYRYVAHARYLSLQFFVFAFIVLILHTIVSFYKKELFMKNKKLFYIIPVVIISELSLFSHDFNNPKCTYDPFINKRSLSFLEKKKEEGLYRIGRYKNIDKYGDTVNWLPQILPPNLTMLYEIYDIQGYDSLTISDYMSFLSIINKDSRKVKKPYPLTVNKHLDSKLLDFLNVKYLLTSDFINNDKYKLVYDKEIRIYENLNVLPRFFVVKNVFSVKEKQKAKDFISKKRFNPETSAIIEGDIPSFFNKGKGLLKSSPNNLRIIKYTPNEIILKAGNSYESVFLVSSEVFYPGWKVYVDDYEGNIYKTNLAFRGVFLDRGIHKVKFVYEPPSFKKGIMVSVSGILSLIFLICFYLIYRKRKKYEDTMG